MENQTPQTEATPLYIDLNTSILMCWYEANRVIAKRKYYEMNGADVYHAEVIKAVYRLFLHIKNSWKKDFNKEESKEDWEFIINSFNPKTKPIKCHDVLNTFEKIDAWLYAKGVTKFDTKIKYNRTIVENANNFRGF